MSDEGATDYTNLSFLSNLRTKPKNNFKGLSLNTDLEEIDMILKSPRGTTIIKIPEPKTLDKELTKRFVLELLRKYESEDEAQKKWQGFVQSVSSPPQFQKFVESLKQIKEDQKVQESKPNPETSNGDSNKSEEQKLQKKENKSSSCQKKLVPKPQKNLPMTDKKLRQKIKSDLQELKDLLMAGERFIREA